MPSVSTEQGGAAQSYLAALLEPDPARAREVLRAAVDAGLPVSAAYAEVIAPALEEIGRLWETGELSVAHEHLASEVSSSVVDELAQRIRRPAVSGRLAVVTCTPGERHCIGGQMLAALLQAADWEVFFLGGSLPTDELAALVDRERPEVVALSTTIVEYLPAARETVAAVRGCRSPPLVIAGGQAYASEAAAKRIGADAWAPDAASATAVLAERIRPAE